MTPSISPLPEEDLHMDCEHRYATCSNCIDEIMDGGTYDLNFDSMYDVKWRIREVITDTMNFYKQYDTMRIVTLPSNGRKFLYPLGKWELTYCEQSYIEYIQQPIEFVSTNSDDFKKAFFNSYEETFIYITMEEDIRFKVNGTDERLDGFLPIE